MTQIGEYNGWPNRMTWAVFTELGSDYDTYSRMRDVAVEAGEKGVREQVYSWVEQWFERRRVPDGVNVLMQSMLNCAVDFAWWWRIVDVLQGERELEFDNPFTQVLFDAVREMNWQSFIADPSQPEESASVEEHVSYALSGFDERLKEYCRTILLTWADSRTRKQPTAANKLARQITKVYLDQVVWENVAKSYKGE